MVNPGMRSLRAETHVHTSLVPSLQSIMSTEMTSILELLATRPLLMRPGPVVLTQATRAKATLTSAAASAGGEREHDALAASGHDVAINRQSEDHGDDHNDNKCAHRTSVADNRSGWRRSAGRPTAIWRSWQLHGALVGIADEFCRPVET